MVWKRLTFRGGLERDICSSFPSNRFDMAPLWYVVPLLIELPRSTGSEDGRDWGVPAKYIEAFPFPGREAGRRLTITEDERGIIWESSLCSTVGRTGKYSGFGEIFFSRILALFGGSIEDMKVKVIGLTHIVGEYDFTLQIKDGYASAVEGHSRLVLPWTEFVKNRRCHLYWPVANTTSGRRWWWFWLSKL